MTIAVDGADVVVRAHGDGMVSIDGLGDEWRGPFEIPAAMGVLAKHGAFENDSDKQYTSGSWDAGDVAAVVAPWYDMSGIVTEFIVDDIEMYTDGQGKANPTLPTEAEVLTLATDSWEIEGGGSSPWHDGSGEMILLRIGPRYVVWQYTSRFGWDVVEPEVTAASDEEAVAWFEDGYSS